jgi:hypothetical protein
VPSAEVRHFCNFAQLIANLDLLIEMDQAHVYLLAFAGGTKQMNLSFVDLAMTTTVDKAS